MRSVRHSNPVPPTATPIPPEPNAVSYNAVNYAFAGPPTLPSGLTEITLTNVSDKLHMQQLIKLPDDMTIGDFMTVLAESAPEDPPPPGLESVGGVSVIAPEISATSSIDLEAGSYIMICFVADPKGVPHFALGMVLPLTVTPAADRRPRNLNRRSLWTWSTSALISRAPSPPDRR